jgi:peptidoglycan/LPS O-acetylase OafA/YrhL
VEPIDVAPDTRFRPDIEGLRAVAVILVMLYHARFLVAAGGFIGVDVFFVLSGYLITSLLLKELVATGTISLRNFWARRARRLLPASGLVLAATLLASHFMLDGLSQADLAHDAMWASVFAVNLRFAAVGVDYLNEGLPKSPLLHYWSLAVEEQFYLLWPLLLLLCGKVLRLGKRHFALVLGTLWLLSLITCVAVTRDTTIQPWAFFSLPTRAWELLTGALMAVLGGRLARLKPQPSAILGWLGLGVIVACAIQFSEQMSLPGAAVLVPVLATAAVINTGGAAAPEGPVLLLRTRPLQWIGARSYAIYLWHFPMLILADRKWGPLPVAGRLALLAGSVALAALSFRLIENPVRHSPMFTRWPSRSLAMGACVVVLGLTGAVVLQHNPPRLSAGGVAAPIDFGTSSTTSPTASPPTSDASRTVGPTAATNDPTSTAHGSTAPDSTAAAPSSTGAVTHSADASHDNPPVLQAMIDANLPKLQQGVLVAAVPSNMAPNLAQARKDLPSVYSNGCILDLGQSTPKQCVYGDPTGTVTVVLFGDSHIAEWVPAADRIAQANHWKLLVHAKKACPDAEIPVEKDPSGCATWRQKVIDQIAQLHPALVVLSSYRYKQVGAAAGRDPDAVWQQGIDLTVSKLRPDTDHLLLLGDTATPLGDLPSCVAAHVASVLQCMNTRTGATRPGRLAVERSVAAKYHAVFIPTSDWMCTASQCPVIVGNVLMYRDVSHLTATAAVLLAPYLDAALHYAMS